MNLKIVKIISFPVKDIISIYISRTKKEQYKIRTTLYHFGKFKKKLNGFLKLHVVIYISVYIERFCKLWRREPPCYFILII